MRSMCFCACLCAALHLVALLLRHFLEFGRRDAWRCRRTWHAIKCTAIHCILFVQMRFNTALVNCSGLWSCFSPVFNLAALDCRAAWLSNCALASSSECETRSLTRFHITVTAFRDNRRFSASALLALTTKSGVYCMRRGARFPL